MTSYWFTRRPEEVEHRHPFLVFDCHDQLHFPLTVFAKEACVRVEQETVQTYLYSMLPYFTYLETDVWQVRAGIVWNAASKQVRQAVDDYLVNKLQCKVQPHHYGWKSVSLTAGTRSSLRVFLAALKLFYQVMIFKGYYTSPNPMVDTMSATITAVETRMEREEQESTAPHMPARSGVIEPEKRPKYRLTDSYYKLQHEEWVPQILDDPKLPALIFRGGKLLSLKHTRQRDEVVTWLLFDTGARISEVTGLMLGDWASLGTHNKAHTFNKGSNGRRVKQLSFADDTVMLLKRYFDEERIRFDPHGYTLENYLLLAKQKYLDLRTVPLFLTMQGTQFTPKEYREHYWNPACAALDIEADVHQVRHWHVTREVRDIYETAKDKAEIERRLRGLVQYMKWSSEETLDVYQHYFDEQLNDDKREDLHKRMHEEVRLYLQERQPGKQGKHAPQQNKYNDQGTKTTQSLVLQREDEPNMAFIYSFAGEV